MAATASATLQNLETRLRRLEHYLDPAPTQGSGDDRQTPDVEAVQSRLRKLESQTADALGSNQHIQALAQLCMSISHQKSECINVTRSGPS